MNFVCFKAPQEHKISRPNGVGGLMERSLDEILKPVHMIALAQWEGFYPANLVQSMQEFC